MLFSVKSQSQLVFKILLLLLLFKKGVIITQLKLKMIYIFFHPSVSAGRGPKDPGQRPQLPSGAAGHRGGQEAAPREGVGGRDVRTSRTERWILGERAVGAAEGVRRPRVSVPADAGARHAAVQTGGGRRSQRAGWRRDSRDVPASPDDAPPARLPAVRGVQLCETCESSADCPPSSVPLVFLSGATFLLLSLLTTPDWVTQSSQSNNDAQQLIKQWIQMNFEFSACI